MEGFEPFSYHNPLITLTENKSTKVSLLIIWEKNKNKTEKPNSFYNIASPEANSAAIIGGINLKRITVATF